MITDDMNGKYPVLPVGAGAETMAALVWLRGLCILYSTSVITFIHT